MFFQWLVFSLSIREWNPASRECNSSCFYSICIYILNTSK